MHEVACLPRTQSCATFFYPLPLFGPKVPVEKRIPNFYQLLFIFLSVCVCGFAGILNGLTFMANS